MTDDMLALLAALVFSAGQAQPPPPPRDRPSTPSGSGIITGQITRQDTGQPLPRALVTLLNWNWQQRVETETDTDGRYTFTGLADEEYTVYAGPGDHKSTYLRQGFGHAPPLDVGSMPPRGGVELKAGEVRRDINIALMRALAIEGRVIDSIGEPMAGVQVSVVRPDGTPYSSYPAYTDDGGEYRIFGLKPGRYRVCAQPERSGASSDGFRVMRTCYPTSVGAASAGDVVLTRHDATGIDIQAQLGRTFTISGIVIDASGTPVHEAYVTAVSLDERTHSATGRSERGRITIGGVLPGRYVLRASVGGPANPSDTRTPAREREVGYAHVEITSADLANVAIALGRGTKLAGRVIFEGDPPDPSRSRMVVQAGVSSLVLMSLFDGRPPFSSVDENLAFELSGVFGLPMTVSLSGVPVGWALRAVRFDGRDITGLPTDFTDGSGARRLELVLTNRVANPAVRVAVTAGGSPAIYRVALLPPDPARWRGGLTWVGKLPSKDGVVALGAIVPGEYLVAALPIEDSMAIMNDSNRIDDLASVATRVRFTERDTQTLDLVLVQLPAARR